MILQLAPYNLVRVNHSILSPLTNAYTNKLPAASAAEIFRPNTHPLRLHVLQSLRLVSLTGLGNYRSHLHRDNVRIILKAITSQSFSNKTQAITPIYLSTEYSLRHGHLQSRLRWQLMTAPLQWLRPTTAPAKSSEPQARPKCSAPQSSRWPGTRSNLL